MKGSGLCFESYPRLERLVLETARPQAFYITAFKPMGMSLMHLRSVRPRCFSGLLFPNNRMTLFHFVLKELYDSAVNFS